MKNTLRVALGRAALLLMLAGPSVVFAAGEEVGRIIGRVVEEQTGAPVPGAQITVTGPALIGPPRTTQTADDGSFEIPNLKPGPYDVEVAYSGVKPIKRRILVRPSEAAPLEIAWSAELAAVETTVVQEERHLTKPETAVAGATFSMEKQNLLPVTRNYQSVVTQAPGVNENASGNPRVKGANDRNNRVLIDGLDTTDPVTNTFSANIGQDSLAGVQVITSGFEAKYNAVGSIINLITLSGSDDLHFGISFYTRPKGLQTFHTQGASNQPFEGARLIDHTPQPPSNVYQGNFNIGGPIIKHQLWYNLGAQLDYSTSVQPAGPPLNKQAPLRVFQDIFPQGKITWAPSSKHRLMVEVLGDPTYIDYENNNTATANNTAPQAANGRFQGGYKVLSEWDYFINQNFDTKVLGGYSFNKLDVGPQGAVRSIDASLGGYPGFDVPGHVNQFDNTSWRNSQLRQTTSRHRFQLDGALTWRGRTGEMSHEAEAGFQTSYTYHNITNAYTGMGDYYLDNNPAGLDRGFCDHDLTVRADPNVITGVGCNTLLHNDTYSSLQRGYMVGLYVQDRFKPTSWLTLIPGIRWDINRIWLPGGVPDDYKRTININGRDVQTSDYQMGYGFGPRFSAIFDVTGDQKTIFQASYGRSTEELYLTVMSGVDGSVKGRQLQYTWNQNTRTFDLLTSSPNNSLVDSSSRTLPHSDEIFFRLSRELFRNTVGEINYTYKYFSNILEQIETNRVFDASGSRIIGYADPSHPNAVFVYSNDDRNWSKYSGFDFIFETKPTPNLDFFGAYTLSWTWGPGYGENLGAGTATNPAPGQFYNPRYNQFFYGYNILSDVRHNVKTQLLYTWHGAVLGTTVNWRSGYARSKFYPAMAPLTNNTRLRSPLGTDPSTQNDTTNWTDLRLPDLFTVNLLVGYDFYEVFRQHLLLTVQIENLFDNFTPIGFTTFETAAPSQFGRPNSRPVPFRTQLGFRYTY